MDGARPLRRFGVLARRWVSCDFADVELFVRPRNRARGEGFGSRARSIFFVNAVRAPHPLGEESGFGGWWAIMIRFDFRVLSCLS